MTREAESQQRVPEGAEGGSAEGKELAIELPTNGQLTLLVDGRPVAVLDIAASRAARRRGLIGQPDVVRALLLPGVRAVHTVGVRIAIDVAYLDARGIVLDVTRMRRWRVGRQRRQASAVLEAAAGSFARWGVRPGVLVSSVGATGDA
jgi:uncharacterized protein